MKTSIKVFLILSIVLGGMLIVTSIVLGVLSPIIFENFFQGVSNTTQNIYAFSIVWTIYMILLFIASVVKIVVASIAINKVNKAKTANEIMPIGIVTLLLSSFIAGLLMMLCKDSDLE